MKLKYTIPETKADITVKTYLKIRKLYKNAELMEIDVDEKELVSVVLDVPLEFINKIPQTEYNEALNNITNALNQDAKLYLTFKLKGVKYGFLNDMDNMTTGEYSALDGFSKDVDANCYSILNALYRPVINERFYKSWFSKSKKGKYTIESYNPNNDLKMFEDAPYEIYESALVFFFQFRERFSKLYPELYESSGTEADNRSIRFANKWGWYQTYDTFAKAECIGIDKVGQYPIGRVFKRLAYESDKAKLMRPIKK